VAILVIVPRTTGLNLERREISHAMGNFRDFSAAEVFFRTENVKSEKMSNPRISCGLSGVRRSP